MMTRSKLKNKYSRDLLKLSLLAFLFIAQFVLTSDPINAPGEKATPFTGDQQNYDDQIHASLNMPPITEPNAIVEFNDTDILSRETPTYQYGYAETALFYGVSGGACTGLYAPTKVNITLPSEYADFWNLAQVGFFDKRGINDQSKDVYFPAGPGASTGINQTVSLNDSITAGENSTKILELNIVHVTAISIHFSSLDLGTGGNISIYNETFDTTQDPKVRFDRFNQTTQEWTGFINCTRLVILLNSSTSPANYTIDMVTYTGTPFQHTFSNIPASEAFIVEVDPDVIGYKINLSDIYVSSGMNITLYDPDMNFIASFNSTNYSQGIGWCPVSWLAPDYLKFVAENNGSAVNPSYIEIERIMYYRTRGWQRYNAAKGETSFFVNYDYAGHNITVDLNAFTGGNLSVAYSSWSFLFHKRPFDITMKLKAQGESTWRQGPIYNISYNTEYNITFNANDTINGLPIDMYNIIGVNNHVQVSIWQNNTVYHPAAYDLQNGIANYTFNISRDLPASIGGPIYIFVEIQNVNYGAYDNTSARATFVLYFYEQPTLEIDEISSENIPATTSTSISTTAGTIYDPNTVTFKVSAHDMHGNDEPLNGQPVVVRVRHESSLIFTETILQNFHGGDAAIYAEFSYDFLEEGDWDVSFTLGNESLGKPHGFFMPAAPVMIAVHVLPRPFLIDIYSGAAGLNPGIRGEVFVNVTDVEEAGFPLTRWLVDVLCLAKFGNQFTSVPLGSTTTSTLGIAKVDWTPGVDLAGKEIFIIAQVETPESEKARFVDRSSMIKKGFSIDKLATSINIITAKDEFYFDENLAFDVTLKDELGESLLACAMDMSIMLTSNQSTIVLNFEIVIGKNNTGIIFPITSFTGEVQIDVIYNGSSSFHPTVASRTLFYVPVPTRADIIVDPAGYHLGPTETVPIQVSIVDTRFSTQFFDTGTVTFEVFNENRTMVHQESIVITTFSEFTFTGWTLPGNETKNGLYTVSVHYSGGMHHKACTANVSVLIDRAEVEIDLEEPQVLGGEPLVLNADVHYAKNSTHVNNVQVIFEFTDKLGNVYILGNNSTSPLGQVRLEPDFSGAMKYVYWYMIEFGGSLSATTFQDFRYASSFDMIAPFQIQKCLVNIVIRLPPGGIYAHSRGLITPVITTPTGINPPGSDDLTWELWSVNGVFDDGISKVGSPAFDPYFGQTGIYFIKVSYNGSHEYQAASAFTTFEITSDRPSSSRGLSKGNFIDANVAIFTANGFYYSIVLLFVFTIGIIAIFKMRMRKADQVLLLGLVLIAVVLGADVLPVFLDLFPSAHAVTFSDFSVSGKSEWEWLNSEDLPSDEKEKILANMNESLTAASSMIEDTKESVLESNSIDLYTKAAEYLGGALGRSSGEIKDVGLGTFGNIPFPIGDELNVSFSVTEASHYMIYITDVNTNQRVKAIFGECAANDHEENIVLLEPGVFQPGAKYALELDVYPKGRYDYQLDRSSRRMLFSIVKGFVAIKNEIPNIELGMERTFKVSLVEDFSYRPLSGQALTILTYNETSRDFQEYRTAITDIQGAITLPLPENARKGEIPLKIIYTGDKWHYGTQNATLYTINPVSTSILLSASPARYTDNATAMALLQDRYGARLTNSCIYFTIYIENASIGDIERTQIEDAWINIGEALTNDEGVATVTFPANYPANNYTIRAYFDGDEIHNNCTEERVVLQIEPEDLQIEFIQNSVVHGMPGAISAYIKDDEGIPGPGTNVTFYGYYNHCWIALGNTTTMSDGLATINVTIPWPAGTYLLRVVKVQDDRYSNNLEYGTLHVAKTSGHLNVALNSTEYKSNVTISARMTYVNGSSIDPVQNESILFYVDYDVPGEGKQFVYIGYGVTDENGTARLEWFADLPPAIYIVKAVFPGNGYIDPVETCEYGLKVEQAQAKIAVTIPAQVCILDFADFSFNLTNAVNDTLWGEKIQIKVYNRTNAADVVYNATLITDTRGYAYFRWVPITLGNFTVQADLMSQLYRAPSIRADIEAIRKAIVFNTTINDISFFRGDLCTVTGNVSYAYLHQNNTIEYIPVVIPVPLRFFIWNESYFEDPRDGYLVPNVPLKNQQNESLVYTENGQFNWFFKFEWPGNSIGLQSGRYFLRIKVDTTLQGFFEGQTFISFDLVEKTTLTINIKPLARVEAGISNGSLVATHKFYVNEEENITIQLRDQDSEGLQVKNYAALTNRDLLLLIGRDNLRILFHITETGTCELYSGTSIDPLKQLNNSVYKPSFDITTGTYRFYYIPKKAGASDVSVSYLGDRFFTLKAAVYARTVYLRPVTMDSSISHTKDLYRASTSHGDFQNFTWFDVSIRDTITQIVLPGRVMQYHIDNTIMTYEVHGLRSNTTDGSGRVVEQWFIPDSVKAGHHAMKFVCPADNVYATATSTPVILEVWEVTTSTVQFVDDPTNINKKKVIIKLYDQDNLPIRDANYSVMISPSVSDTTQVGGLIRVFSTLITLGEVGELVWEFDDSTMSGPFNVMIDFLGDYSRNLRATSNYIDGHLDKGTQTGIRDILRYNDVPARANMYVVNVSGIIYWNIQEVRRYYSITDSDIKVNTADGFGFCNPMDVWYVWVESDTDDHYSLNLIADMPRIVAYGNKHNALEFIASNPDFAPRLVDWDFVWPRFATISPGSKSSLKVNPKYLLKGKNTSFKDAVSFLSKDWILSQIGSKELGIMADGLGISDSIGSSGGSNVFAQFFGAVAECALDNQVKFPYVLMFRIIEYLLSGGTAGWPDRYKPVFTTTSHADAKAVLDFSPAILISTNPNTTLNITEPIQNILQVQNLANISEVGEYFTIDLSSLGDVFNDTCGLYIKMKYTGDSGGILYKKGMKITLWDDEGNYVDCTRGFDASVYSDNFMVVNIDYGQFEEGNVAPRDFSFNKITSIQFSVVENGFFTKPNQVLTIDDIGFFINSFSWTFIPEKIGSNGDFWTWLYFVFLRDFIARQLYDTLCFFNEKDRNPFFLSSLSQGLRKDYEFDDFFDEICRCVDISIIVSPLGFFKFIGAAYSVFGTWVVELLALKAIKKINFTERYQHKAYTSKFVKDITFLFTTFVQSLLNAIPTYDWDPAFTWYKIRGIREKNGKAPSLKDTFGMGWQIIKKGMPKSEDFVDDFKKELIPCMALPIFGGALNFLADLCRTYAPSWMSWLPSLLEFLVNLVFDLYGVIGKEGTAASIIEDIEESDRLVKPASLNDMNPVALAVGSNMVGFIIDLILDIVCACMGIDLEDLPWWLTFLIELVKIAAQIVVSVYTAPNEFGLQLPGRMVALTILKEVVMYGINTFLMPAVENILMQLLGGGRSVPFDLFG